MKKRTVSPQISVVVVNYNGLKWLKPCFEALKKTKYPASKLEFIFVDNVSEDDSISFMREQYPQVKILLNSENNYTSANNLGIKKSKGELVALLNNDTEVTPGW